MNRFFKKSDTIDTLTRDEMNEFIHDEGLANKVTGDRVEDFYNYLSRASINEEIETVKTDYKYFCRETEPEKLEMERLRESETDYLSNINPDILSGSRLLKAAAALAYHYEKQMKGEPMEEQDANKFLRRLFTFEEDPNIPDKPATFGELVSMNMLFLRYIALLSQKKAFRTASGYLEEDRNGKICKYTVMEKIEDVMNGDLIQMAMPDFSKKLAAKDLYTRKRFSKKEKGQNLIILVDDSGSMSEASKKAMLQAALTLKLNDCSDRHNVYIGTFESKVYGFVKIEKGMKFNQLTFINLNKGGTQVNRCIKDTIENIKQRELPSFGGNGKLPLSEDHFEILVINDGQDAVDKRFHPEIKIHALCLLQSNLDLRNICHRSGGTYFHLQGNE